MFDEIGGQTRRAPRAKILARQKQRGVPAIVRIDEAAHELAERRDVGGRIPEVRGAARLVGAAECGAHGIHENQVRLAEQRIADCPTHP